MVPLLVVDGFFVFFPPDFKRTARLANVGGFFIAGTLVLVDAFAFLWRGLGGIFAAENVL